MYSYNPYYSNYLMHYGTPQHSGRYPYGSGDRPYQHASIGRKFIGTFAKGKAYQYSYDINRHRRNASIRGSKNQYKSGELTKEEYKASKKAAKIANKVANYKDINEINEKYKQVTSDPTKKISEIYKSYKDTAIKEIPHYQLKKAAMTAGQIAGGALIGIGITGASEAIANMNRLNKMLAPGSRYTAAKVQIVGPLLKTKVTSIGGNDPLLAATRRAIFNYTTPHVVAGSAAIAAGTAIKNKKL